MCKALVVRALCLAVAVFASANVAICDNSNAAPANPKTTSAPSIIETAQGSPAAAINNVIAQSLTTGKPASQSNAASRNDEVKVTAAPVAAVSSEGTAKSSGVVAAQSGGGAVASTVSPAERVGQYFEPICGQLDKLQPKQMFKIQSQLKQFVEKTAGKMSLCFMQTYSMDPNLTPTNKAQLQTICDSKKLDAGAKGSFKSFLECAARNYDQALDAELARVHKSRASLGANHDHSKDNLANLMHDDDELSLISEVVNKVIADSKIDPSKADVRVVDLNGPKGGEAPSATGVSKTTAAPVAAGSKSGSVAPVAAKAEATTQSPSLLDKLKPSGGTVEKLANGVLNSRGGHLDGAQANKETTKPPQESGSKAGVAQTTGAPKSAISVSTSAPAKADATTAAPRQAAPAEAGSKGTEIRIILTTPAPANAAGGLGEKIASAVGVKTTAAPAAGESKSAVTGAPQAGSTAAPRAESNLKTTAAGQPRVAGETSTATSKPAAESTKKPEATPTAAPETRAASAASAAPAAAGSSTGKPQEQATGVSNKQDKEKAATDSRASEAQVSKAGEKKDDDLDAKKAIKSLQAQRAQAHGSPADIRMHQIEHERQMSLDPVGHTIKHQEYEKRRSALAGAKAASTTKKPQ